MPDVDMKEAREQVDEETPLNELLTRSMVDLYVGQENTHWVLHEKLLCARSGFFHSIFQKKRNAQANSNTKSFGLPDEDDEPFRAFVGWLYSGQIMPPRVEDELTTLLELYLMGERWAVPGLERDALETVREWYRDTDTYPGLRRVQYIYANTAAESPMRALLVNSVARMLALGDGIPKHWDKALRKNGQLAVDLILSVQSWRLEPELVPDPREDPLEAVGVDVEDLSIDETKVGEELEKSVAANGGGEQLANGWTEYEPDTKPIISGIKSAGSEAPEAIQAA